MLRRLLATILLLPACSFLLVKEPSEAAIRDKRVPLDCTTSRGVPLADLAIGTAAATAIAVLVYSTVQSFNQENMCVGEGCYTWKPAALSAFLVGSPFWIAGAVGISDTGNCRDAYDARREPALTPPR